MPRVTVLDLGESFKDYDEAEAWRAKRKDLYVDTDGIRDLLGSHSVPDKLILSIRDSIIIKALRSNRNIIVGGNNSQLEQIERIAEVVESQAYLDGTSETEPANYSWKVKRF